MFFLRELDTLESIFKLIRKKRHMDSMGALGKLETITVGAGVAEHD